MVAILKYHHCTTDPFRAVKSTSGLAARCSTVGQRTPICRRRRLLKICETSFLASNSKRQMLDTKSCRTSLLYTSCASCATCSGCGSVSAATPCVQSLFPTLVISALAALHPPPSPYKIAFIWNRFLETSSLAYMEVKGKSARLQAQRALID